MALGVLLFPGFGVVGLVANSADLSNHSVPNENPKP